MNATMVHLNQQIVFALRQDLYAIDMDHRRNCYNCSGFGHIVKIIEIRELCDEEGELIMRIIDRVI